MIKLFDVLAIVVEFFGIIVEVLVNVFDLAVGKNEGKR